MNTINNDNRHTHTRDLEDRLPPPPLKKIMQLVNTLRVAFVKLVSKWRATDRKENH